MGSYTRIRRGRAAGVRCEGWVLRVGCERLGAEAWVWRVGCGRLGEKVGCGGLGVEGWVWKAGALQVCTACQGHCSLLFACSFPFQRSICVLPLPAFCLHAPPVANVSVRGKGPLLAATEAGAPSFALFTVYSLHWLFRTQ
eukprot:347758-Chlamydomonas_euryale.AAC.7